MKEHVQKTGVRRYAGDDFIELQAEPLKVIQSFFEKCGNCVINGCEVIPAGNKYNVTGGIVSISGTDADGVQAAKVVPFAGVDNVTLPIYLTLTFAVSERVYGDGKVKPIAYNYTAVAAGVQPAEGIEFLEITSAGGKQFVDAIKVTEKLDKIGNGKDVSVTFAEAAERANVSSGEKLSTLFGKVRKWFAGLATVAFTGKAADLTQDASNRLVTDTEKTSWADKYTRTEVDSKDTATLQSAKEHANGVVNTLSGDVYRKAQTDSKDATTLQAAKEYAAAKVAEIVNSSPGTLDTLSELAAALGNDPNFATSIMALIGGKADRAHGHAISEVTNLQSELNGKLTESSLTESGTGDDIRTDFPAGLVRLHIPGVEYTSILQMYDYINQYSQLKLTPRANSDEIKFRTSGTNTWKTIWHEGNFNPAGFLQKEGNQTINANLILNTSNASFIYFDRNEEHKGYVGCGSTTVSDVLLANVVSSGHIRVADDGKNYSNGKEIATTDQLDLKANANHNHDNAYAPKTHSHNYEPAFNKNNAFNKNFGTTAETVAEGNHTHAGMMRVRFAAAVSESGAVYPRIGAAIVARTGVGVYKITHNLNIESPFCQITGMDGYMAVGYHTGSLNEFYVYVYEGSVKKNGGFSISICE